MWFEDINEWTFPQNRSVLRADVIERRGSDTMIEDYFAVCRALKPCWLSWISWIRNASYSATCEIQQGPVTQPERARITWTSFQLSHYTNANTQWICSSLNGNFTSPIPIKIILETNENWVVFGAMLDWTMGMSKACEGMCHVYFSLPRTYYLLTQARISWPLQAFPL
jgi:hypothetical protein